MKNITYGISRVKIPTYEIPEKGFDFIRIRSRSFGIMMRRFILSLNMDDFMDIKDGLRRHVLYKIKNGRKAMNGDEFRLQYDGEEIRVQVTSVDDKFVKRVKKRGNKLKEAMKEYDRLKDSCEDTCCMAIPESKWGLKNRLIHEHVGTQVIGFKIMVDIENNDKEIFDKINNV